MKTINDLTPKQKQAISDDAQGTCQSVEDLAEHAGLGDEPNGVDLVNEAIAEIGEHELCNACSWWCELSEDSGNPNEFVCQDCADGERGDD